MAKVETEIVQVRALYGGEHHKDISSASMLVGNICDPWDCHAHQLLCLRHYDSARHGFSADFIICVIRSQLHCQGYSPDSLTTGHWEILVRYRIVEPRHYVAANLITCGAGQLWDESSLRPYCCLICDSRITYTHMNEYACTETFRYSPWFQSDIRHFLMLCAPCTRRQPV